MRENIGLFREKHIDPMKILEDIICIFLLIFLPDYILEKTGLYKSMEVIINERNRQRHEQ